MGLPLPTVWTIDAKVSGCLENIVLTRVFKV